MTNTQTAAEERIPGTVLTGFLGSGKTTLLGRLLRSPDLADTAVVVNEFGAVGLDHLLIARGEEDDVFLLDNGCLCCSFEGGLGETLTKLFHRRARRDMPRFRRVVIETSGLADPGPILHALMTDRFTAGRFAIGAVIATVDAQHGLDQIVRYRETGKQIALADRIVLTKTDVAREAVGEIRARVRALNGQAEILEAVYGDIAADAILAPPEIARQAPGHIHAEAGPHEHHHHHHHEIAAKAIHSQGIASVFVEVDRPVSWPAYAAFVRHCQMRLGGRLLRVKGILDFEDGAKIIQGVERVFAPPADFADAAATRGLVFIGQDLSAGAIEAAADLLVAEAGSP
jgi:G3E family GTPase